MLQGLPRELQCPLTTLPFHNPVLTSDGFTFERSAIEEWFSKGNSTNPITFSPLPSLQLHQNSILKSVMGKYKDLIDRVQGLQIKCEALSKTVYGLEVENKVLRGMVEQHQLQNRQPIHIEAPTALTMCEKYYDSAASALSILPYRSQLQSATITIQSTLPPTQPYLPHNPGYPSPITKEYLSHNPEYHCHQSQVYLISTMIGYPSSITSAVLMDILVVCMSIVIGECMCFIGVGQCRNFCYFLVGVILLAGRV